MALSTNLFHRDLTPSVLFEEHYKGVRKAILNRPSKLNALTYEMVSRMLKKFQIYEKDPTVNLVILKANGKAFCAGGDAVGNVSSMLTGHWSYGASFYRKQLTLDHLIATYNKPVVCLIDGVVMGGGAGISMNGSLRIVTENTVFAMPEASLGLFPDVGASYFLSRLPGYLGEYLGLTGARLDGATMLACGLATHFVFSKDLPALEHALTQLGSSNASEIWVLTDKYAHIDNKRAQEELNRRLEIINKCFSRRTVEEILHFLERQLLEEGAEKWIADAVNKMKSSSPTGLKIFLRMIREGRGQSIEQCLTREYTALCNILQRKITNDFYEGSRAMLWDKDKKPKWEPSKLELVGEEMVDRFFKAVEDDDEWKGLQLPARTRSSLMDQTHLSRL